MPKKSVPRKKKKNSKHLLLIDGNNLLARNAHVNLGYLTPEGVPVGGLFGMVRQLRGFVASRSFDHIVVVMDYGVPNMRYSLVPDYKQARKEKAKTDKKYAQFIREYRPQIKLVHKVMKPLGVTVARAKGYEADDVIAGFARIRYRDCRITIFSDDKDLIQLATERVRVWRPSSRKEHSSHDPWYVLARAMEGDPSDGIPGVPSIGTARAATLITESSLPDITDEDIDLDRFFELLPDNKHGNVVREYSQKVRDYVKVMDLSELEEEANASALFCIGNASPEKFMGICKKYHLKMFAKDRHFYMAPFLRCGPFVKGYRA